jgi:hypothetical protein
MPRGRRIRTRCCGNPTGCDGYRKTKKPSHRMGAIQRFDAAIAAAASAPEPAERDRRTRARLLDPTNVDAFHQRTLSASLRRSSPLAELCARVER